MNMTLGKISLLLQVLGITSLLILIVYGILTISSSVIYGLICFDSGIMIGLGFGLVVKKDFSAQVQEKG